MLQFVQISLTQVKKEQIRVYTIPRPATSFSHRSRSRSSRNHRSAVICQKFETPYKIMKTWKTINLIIYLKLEYIKTLGFTTDTTPLFFRFFGPVQSAGKFCSRFSLMKTFLQISFLVFSKFREWDGMCSKFK